jgi:hypothetical protein
VHLQLVRGMTSTAWVDNVPSRYFTRGESGKTDLDPIIPILRPSISPGSPRSRLSLHIKLDSTRTHRVRQGGLVVSNREASTLWKKQEPRGGQAFNFNLRAKQVKGSRAQQNTGFASSGAESIGSRASDMLLVLKTERGA